MILRALQLEEPELCGGFHLWSGFLLEEMCYLSCSAEMLDMLKLLEPITSSMSY